VHEGQQLGCEPPLEEPARLLSEEGDLAVLYEDADLVVLDKPSGLVVHPGAGRPTGTLVHRLVARYPELSGVGHPRRPGIVHRLDRETSGVMVVARTDQAYQQLCTAFAARTPRKLYLAIAHGLTPERASLEAPIGRHSIDRTRMTVRQGGRSARTSLRRLDLAPENVASLLALRLHTGRTHQIRVHLKQAGHPLVGDPVYGEARWRGLTGTMRKALEGFARPALHAWRLELDHPTTGARLAWTAPIPEDLDALWRALTGRALTEIEPPPDL
jgi:23S rRNA pseudouridine1911/1915/1917 synthase